MASLRCASRGPQLSSTSRTSGFRPVGMAVQVRGQDLFYELLRRACMQDEVTRVFLREDKVDVRLSKYLGSAASLNVSRKP